jgi:hypothetical protein
LHFAFCLQQNINSRVGFLAEERRLRAAKIANIAKIGHRRNWKGKNFTADSRGSGAKLTTDLR